MFGAPTMWVLFDCFIEALAFAMCFTIWLMLIDGMRFHKVRHGRAAPHPARVPSPLILTALSTSTQAHVYDARFYMFKLPFGLLLLCSYFLLFLVTNPAVDGVDGVDGVHTDKTTLQIVFGLALATNLLLVIWMAFSIVRTLRTLRRIPYLSNRHRQLAFRFFFLHVLMEGGALLIIVIVTYVHALAPALHVAVYIQNNEWAYVCRRSIVHTDVYGSTLDAKVTRFVLMWSAILVCAPARPALPRPLWIDCKADPPMLQVAIVYLPVSDKQLAAYTRPGVSGVARLRYMPWRPGH
jgi:hypothetical protein